jgi:hypothetical protein
MPVACAILRVLLKRTPDLWGARNIPACALKIKKRCPARAIFFHRNILLGRGGAAPGVKK